MEDPDSPQVEAADPVVEAIARRLLGRGERLVVAESLTGGLLAGRLTALAGASRWFLGGFVPYSDSAKQDWLGLPPEILEREGAVSRDAVRALLCGLRERTPADWMMAASGYAGPSGDPAGRVYIGWDRKKPGPGWPVVRCFDFPGGRAAVRSQAVQAALEGLLDGLGEL
jgi:nicotinamide-nucleotide amidase